MRTDGILFEYRCTDGQGGWLTDSSGHQRHAIIRNSTHRWLPYGINFNSHGFIDDSFAIIPAGFSSRIRTITVAAHLSAYNLGNRDCLIGNDISSSIPSGKLMGLSQNSPFIGLCGFGNAVSHAQDTFNGPTVFTWVIPDVGNDIYYYNERPVHTYHGSASSRDLPFADPLYIARWSFNDELNSFGSMATFYYILAFDLPLSAEEVAGNVAYIRSSISARGIRCEPSFNNTYSDTIVAVGDSITYGSGASIKQKGWVDNLSLKPAMKTINFGRPGYQARGTRYALDWADQYWAMGKKLVTFQMGSNDIAIYGATTEQTFSFIVDAVNALRERNIIVVVATLLDRWNIPPATKNALNSAIRAFYGGNTVPGVYLCDLASDPRLGSDHIQEHFYGDLENGSEVVTGLRQLGAWYAGAEIRGLGLPTGTAIRSIDSPTQITLTARATLTGKQASLTCLQGSLSEYIFSPDATHPGDNGHQIIATLMSNALNRAQNGGDGIIRVTSSNYNAKGEDRHILAFPEDNDILITLPAASGRTGDTIKIRNCRLDEDRSVTLETARVDPLYGGAIAELVGEQKSIQVLSGETVELRSVLRGQSPYGCTWEVI